MKTDKKKEKFTEAWDIVLFYASIFVNATLTFLLFDILSDSQGFCLLGMLFAIFIAANMITVFLVYAISKVEEKAEARRKGFIRKRTYKFNRYE